MNTPPVPITLSLRVVKGLLAQAHAIGCDTNTGCWVIQKSTIFDDITLSNGLITFSSCHNKEPQDENISTANTMLVVDDRA